MFDNSNSSYWCSAANQQNNAYLGYDFKEDKIVYLVGIGNGNFKFGSNERCKDVVLQYSDDNTIWENASDIITLEDNNNYTYIWNTKEGNKHRYWRICTVSSYGIHSSIYKMRFYGI